MTSIAAEDFSVHFNDRCYEELNAYLERKKPSKVFILVDSNTKQHCLPYLMSKLDTQIPVEIVEMDAGEASKTIDSCVKVWNTMTALGADRKSLMLNLGGGVVTDLGGFVANTFRRGIPYINIPTSLLGMVDAGIGGKTGVDLGSLKNQIGVIRHGKMVLMDVNFLKTLPDNHMASGFAEMLKHGLIYSRNYWNRLKTLTDLRSPEMAELIYESIQIKLDIVAQDPQEAHLRKSLNFGHTLGHALESHYLESEKELLHGEAIAVGMVMECYLSSKLRGFPKTDLEDVKSTMLRYFDQVSIDTADHHAIIEKLKYDKKNAHGNINFVLLDAIGTPVMDLQVGNGVLLEAFAFYSLQ